MVVIAPSIADYLRVGIRLRLTFPFAGICPYSDLVTQLSDYSIQTYLEIV